MSENQVITPEQLEEYMQGLYAKSKVAQKKFEREFTTNRRVDEVLRAIGMKTCEYAEELCTDALNETKMGNVNDKMSKLKGIVFGQWAICKGQNTVDYGQKETAASHRMMYPMVLKNYIGGMAVVAMSGRPAQRQDQAARIARFAVTPESLRVSMTLRV